MEYTCAYGCGKTYTTSIPKTEEHTWNSGEIINQPTCTSEGTKMVRCQICGKNKFEKIEKIEHTWNKGTVTTEATCTTNGIKRFECAKCGVTKSETIKQTGHKWGTKITYKGLGNGTHECIHSCIKCGVNETYTTEKCDKGACSKCGIWY